MRPTKGVVARSRNTAVKIPSTNSSLAIGLLPGHFVLAARPGKIMKLALISFSLAVVLSAQHLPDIYKDEMHGDPPYLSEPNWHSLLNGKDTSGWHADGGGAHEWFTTRAVNWRRVFNPKLLNTSPQPGDRLVNGKMGKTKDLVSDEKFGDFELYLEFLVPKGSNSGVFLHGLYEVQIFDSYGYAGALMVGDCGGIYADPQGHGGSPPLLNASRPPGDWQGQKDSQCARATSAAQRYSRPARV
jgi:hypothetical protein